LSCARALRGVVVRPPAGESRPSRHIYATVRAGAECSPLIASVLSALGTVARERTIEASQWGACGGCWCMFWRTGSAYQARARDGKEAKIPIK